MVGLVPVLRRLTQGCERSLVSMVYPFIGCNFRVAVSVRDLPMVVLLMSCGPPASEGRLRKGGRMVCWPSGAARGIVRIAGPVWFRWGEVVHESCGAYDVC